MFGALVSWLRRHPLTGFVLLAYGMTWFALAPLVLSAQGLVAWQVPPTWHGLGALGPLLAALIITAAAYGRRGLHDFGRRLGRWRVGWRWVGVTLATSIGLLPLALVLVRAAGTPLELAGFGAHLADGAWLVNGVVLAAVYGLEEPGWRGFMQHHLQRRYPALVAVLIVSAVWALWHLPMFFYRLRLESPLMVVGFFLGMFAGAVWLAYLYNRTGSILMAMLWHALYNLAVALGGVLSGPVVAVATSLVMPLALVALVLGGSRRLGLAASPADPSDLAPTVR